MKSNLAKVRIIVNNKEYSAVECPIVRVTPNKALIDCEEVELWGHHRLVWVDLNSGLRREDILNVELNVKASGHFT